MKNNYCKPNGVILPNGRYQCTAMPCIEGNKQRTCRYFGELADYSRYCKYWGQLNCCLNVDAQIDANKTITKGGSTVNNTTAVQQTSTGFKTPQVLNESQRFTNAVIKEFGNSVELTDRQKGLVQGYFIYIDRALKVAEENRIAKNKNNSDHKWDNNIEAVWKNVNLPDLAKDIVINAKLGLDMTIPNHLFPVPYINRDTGVYDVNLQKGYVGIQIIAEKYAVHKPKNVTVELVYSNDVFIPVKKSKDNPVESYEYSVEKPFDRGELRGGFGYIEFDDPARNKLVIMTMADIMKRKPKHASAEFWGGTKIKRTWDKEKKVYNEEEVKVEGWLEEMCVKTIKREVFSAKYLPIDPQKVDDNYQAAIARDLHYAELEAENVIEENANTVAIETVAPSPQLPPPTDETGADPF